VKREKRKDPDDGEKGGKDKERVAHGSPRPHATTIWSVKFVRDSDVPALSTDVTYDICR
jgi:hypothetical protein